MRCNVNFNQFKKNACAFNSDNNTGNSTKTSGNTRSANISVESDETDYDFEFGAKSYNNLFQEDFETFANRLNSTFPDRTTTKEEKEQAIEAKTQIMNHPDCPNKTKAALKKEISIIKGEIARMRQSKSPTGADQEDFETFADRLNNTFPDRTTTKEEKEQAIEAKTQIMNHPDCPTKTKAALKKEISIIKGEIARMRQR